MRSREPENNPSSSLYRRNGTEKEKKKKKKKKRKGEKKILGSVTAHLYVSVSLFDEKERKREREREKNPLFISALLLPRFRVRYSIKRGNREQRIRIGRRAGGRNQGRGVKNFTGVAFPRETFNDIRPAIILVCPPYPLNP